MINDEREQARKELGEKMKKARERLKLTQADVAKSAGITTTYYAMIERGEVNPSYDKLQGIMKALKLKSLI